MISRVFDSIIPIILNGNHTHHPMEDWSMMGGVMWIWIIIIIAVILVIGLLLVLLMEEDRKRGGKSDTMKSAEQLLDERYARGEITKEEYKEMKKEIRK